MKVSFFRFIGWSIALLLFGQCSLTAGSLSDNERPKYNPVLRFNEDWSHFCCTDFCQTPDPFDNIKHVSMNRCGTCWASFGGHARQRVEYWQHFNFMPKDGCDTFLLNRLFLHGDFHFGDHFRIFTDIKHASSTDRDLPGGRRTLDVDIIDSQNAFVDLHFELHNDAEVTLRGGRQEMLFGKQRLVSPLNWANTRRTFDGGSLIIKKNDWEVTGFWTTPVRVKKYEANDHYNTGEFYGIYATGPIYCDKTHLDLYWLARQRDNAIFNTKSGHEKRHTLGMRVWGADAQQRFRFDLEGAYQFGDLGSYDIEAYMFTANLHRLFPQYSWAPEVGVAFDYASGDNISDGSKSKTFSHLFPLGHAYLGYIDVIGRQNIFDYHSWVSCQPIKKMKTMLHFHHFRRASSKDALYNAGAAVVFPEAAGSSKLVGNELDFTCSYNFTLHLKGEIGYCHFFKGSFVNQALCGSKDIDFSYLMLLYLF